LVNDLVSEVADLSVRHRGATCTPNPDQAIVSASMFKILDHVRRAQAGICSALGLGPSERPWQVIAEGRPWRLREYEARGTGPPVLVVASPIKRPYIWDLAPAVSAVGRCLDHGLRVWLLEWTSPPDGPADLGLDGYAGVGLSDGIAAASRAAGARPFLAGHSLGGSLAAIHAALDPGCAAGLVLLSAPLCFAKGSSPFRDAIASPALSLPAASSMLPGALLSQVSAMADPGTFVWSRLLDAALCTGDPTAMELHARVERWTLDEAPVPGRLVGEILQWLYREDRFCRGTLPIAARSVGPSGMASPILAAVNGSDQVVPRAAVQPFLDAAPSKDIRLLEYPGDTGVALQHVAVLVGRAAHAILWPEILAWIEARG
jgi:polyhydroxyalkanoate synthase